jgi:Ca2+-binding RTX toxin-like protein
MKKATDVMRALWRNRARRNSAAICRRHYPAELLEQRIVPFTTNVNAGALTVTASLANEGLAISVNGSGNVVVTSTVNGTATPTATAVLAANVSSLVVRGEATGANNINLSGVTEAGFTALTSVLVVAGTGADTITGSEFADTIEWNNGDGSDRIDGGAGQDRLVVNGSVTGADAFNVFASNGRLMVLRTSLVAFTLNVGSVEDLVVSAGGGNDTIRVGDTANSGLDNVTLLGGAGDDTVNLTGVNLDALRLVTLDDEVGRDLIVVSAGSDANDGVADRFVLQFEQNPDRPEIRLSVNGSTLFAGTVDTASLQVNGSRDADSLTVIHSDDFDGFTTSSPVPSGGLVFNAGGGAALDQLVIAGEAETAAYDFTNVRNGSAQVDLRSIRFVNVELISDTSSATSRTAFFANGADRVSLSDSEAVDDRVLRLASAGSSPPLTFLQAVGGSFAIDTGAGNDTITIGRLDNNFSGDLLVDSFSGNDRIVIANQSNVTGVINLSADGGEGRDTLDGSAFALGAVLFGGSGDDLLIGGNGNDALLGQQGADTVSGGLGDDNLDGGADADVLVEQADANLTLTAGGLTGVGTDVVVGIERAELTGGNSNNIIDATDFTGVVVLQGLGGADELIGTAFNDTIFGGTGNDSLFGLAGDDLLNGDADNDSLTGGQGDDQLNGGDGNDDFAWVNGDNSDGIVGGAGADALQVTGHETDGDIFRLTNNGGSGARLQRTNLVPFSLNFIRVEFLTVEGGGGADSFTVAMNAGSSRPSDITFGGGDGNDTLDASATSVPIFAFGDAEDDSLIGGRGADTLQGGDGRDVLAGNSGADVLNGNAGNDTITGGAGNDLLNGGDDNDSLDGGTGNDAVAGFAGDDVIRGGTGTDTLAGGSGDNTDVNPNDQFPDAISGEIDEAFLFTMLPNWINDA